MKLQLLNVLLYSSIFYAINSETTENETGISSELQSELNAFVFYNPKQQEQPSEKTNVTTKEPLDSNDPANFERRPAERVTQQILVSTNEPHRPHKNHDDENVQDESFIEVVTSSNERVGASLELNSIPNLRTIPTASQSDSVSSSRTFAPSIATIPTASEASLLNEIPDELINSSFIDHSRDTEHSPLNEDSEQVQGVISKAPTTNLDNSSESRNLSLKYIQNYPSHKSVADAGFYPVEFVHQYPIGKDKVIIHEPHIVEKPVIIDYVIDTPIEVPKTKTSATTKAPAKSKHPSIIIGGAAITYTEKNQPADSLISQSKGEQAQSKPNYDIPIIMPGKEHKPQDDLKRNENSLKEATITSILEYLKPLLQIS